MRYCTNDVIKNRALYPGYPGRLTEAVSDSGALHNFLKNNIKMASHGELRTTCSKQLNFEPAQTLLRLAEENNLVITDAAFATLLDEQDKLKTLREEFYYPKIKDLPTGELIFTL